MYLHSTGDSQPILILSNSSEKAFHETILDRHADGRRGLLAVGAGQSRADSVFDLVWSGSALGNNAIASGTITGDGREFG